jgi:urate oxidase
MALIRSTYGKGRVRIMRVARDTARHEVRELTMQVMLTGDFGRSYTHADNATAVSTDTVKNVVNVVARENLALQNEPFCAVLAQRFLDLYPQIATVTVTAHETRWTRLMVGGEPHAHSFVLDSNGRPFVKLVAERGGDVSITSGLQAFTFMKTTASGWAGYEKDFYTTIPETEDRMCATAMDASWSWAAVPADYAAANATLLTTMLEVFATTYSASVQDSLYRMGVAALAAVPEVREIGMACPNKHYLLINLSKFGLENDNRVLLPTDEPHGQIECVVGRE